MAARRDDPSGKINTWDDSVQSLLENAEYTPYYPNKMKFIISWLSLLSDAHLQAFRNVSKNHLRDRNNCGEYYYGQDCEEEMQQVHTDEWLEPMSDIEKAIMTQLPFEDFAVHLALFKLFLRSLIRPEARKIANLIHRFRNDKVFPNDKKKLLDALPTEKKNSTSTVSLLERVDSPVTTFSKSFEDSSSKMSSVSSFGSSVGGHPDPRDVQTQLERQELALTKQQIELDSKEDNFSRLMDKHRTRLEVGKMEMSGYKTMTTQLADDKEDERRSLSDWMDTIIEKGSIHRQNRDQVANKYYTRLTEASQLGLQSLEPLENFKTQLENKCQQHCRQQREIGEKAGALLKVLRGEPKDP